ncbi:hypothetical protein J4231_01275 [Candidatus Woesearchaeota archaeon]|nr:hypothetical protein [Candidatus Woesearchaeota archaeon]
MERNYYHASSANGIEGKFDKALTKDNEPELQHEVNRYNIRAKQIDLAKLANDSGINVPQETDQIYIEYWNIRNGTMLLEASIYFKNYREEFVAPGIITTQHDKAKYFERQLKKLLGIEVGKDTF